MGVIQKSDVLEVRLRRNQLDALELGAIRVPVFYSENEASNKWIVVDSMWQVFEESNVDGVYVLRNRLYISPEIESILKGNKNSQELCWTANYNKNKRIEFYSP